MQASEIESGIFGKAPNVDQCRPMFTSESQESARSPDGLWESAASEGLLKRGRSHFRGRWTVHHSPHAAYSPSCPGLTRASTTLALRPRKTWIAGSSPAMTKVEGRSDWPVSARTCRLGGKGVGHIGPARDGAFNTNLQKQSLMGPIA